MFKLNLEKTGTRDQLANIFWIIQKAREFQENIYFCFIDYAKIFDCVDHNCGKFLEIGAPETTLHVSRETYVQVKKQQLEPDMEQWSGCKLEKEYFKVLYLTYM